MKMHTLHLKKENVYCGEQLKYHIIQVKDIRDVELKIQNWNEWEYAEKWSIFWFVNDSISPLLLTCISLRSILKLSSQILLDLSIELFLVYLTVKYCYFLPVWLHDLPILYCIVLYCIEGGGHCCPIHCDLFDIYCAPPNLCITRTWICRLNLTQRPIFSGLSFCNES